MLMVAQHTPNIFIMYLLIPRVHFLQQRPYIMKSVGMTTNLGTIIKLCLTIQYATMKEELLEWR